jgi:hypothetical protein
MIWRGSPALGFGGLGFEGVEGEVGGVGKAFCAELVVT